MNRVDRGLHGLLFDLDGTLAQVEMQRFIPAYLDDLALQFGAQVERTRFSRVARQAVLALLARGDANMTNRERYVALIEAQLEIPVALFEERLADWLVEGLPRLAHHVTPVSGARALLDYCFSLKVPVILATNPVFPRAMIDARLRWAGLDDYPFDLITSYENSRYCKPQSGYFKDLLASFGGEPHAWLMVGNDTEHDLAAAKLGMPTFLADTFMIDRLEGNFSSDYRGSLDDLLAMMRDGHLFQ